MDRVIKRERELEELLQAYGELAHKGFQPRFIIGEAGTGKTVLLESFTDTLNGTEEGVIITGSSCPFLPEGSGDYQPFKDIIQSIIQEIAETQESKRTKREKWSRVFGVSADLLLKVAPDLIENFVPMGALITSVSSRVLEETGIQKRVETLKTGDSVVPDLLKIADQYVEVLKMITSRFKLVFYIDNLQWVDRSSADLLHRLSAALKNQPILFIGSYRSTDIDYYSGRERHPLEAFITRMKVNYGDVFIDLDQVGQEDRRSFMEHLLSREKNDYTLSFKDELFRRTGGNPLFVTEMIKALKGNNSLIKRNGEIWYDMLQVEWNIFPVRIEGIIRERVAALDEEKAIILMNASVQGHCFLLQVLAQTLEKPENELLDCLSRELEKQRHLVQEGICSRVGQQLVSVFYFSDCFFREYLYREMSVSRRMLLHSQIARILEKLYAGRTEEVCYELAWHYEKAGEYDFALQYIGICVIRAESKSDYSQVLIIARKGLELLSQTDINTGQATKLFWIQKELTALRITEILMSEERKNKCSLLNDMGKDVGYTGALFWEYWMLQMEQGNLIGARENAQHFILECPEKEKKYAFIADGITCYWLGDTLHSRLILEKQLDTWQETDEYFCWGALYWVLSLFQLSEYDEAEKRLGELIKHSVETGNVYLKTIALLAEVWLAFLDEDTETMKDKIPELNRMASGYHLEACFLWGTLFQGFILGQIQVWKGLEILKHTFHGGYGVTLYALMVGRLCYAKRLYDVFDSCWDKLLIEVENSGEYCYFGELCLLRARYLQDQGMEEEVVHWLAEATVLMERNGKKSIGLE